MDNGKSIPTYALRQATSDLVEDVRRLLHRHVLSNRSGSALEQRQAREAMEVVLEQLEKDVNDCLEEQLWNFIRLT